MQLFTKDLAGQALWAGIEYTKVKKTGTCSLETYSPVGKTNWHSAYYASNQSQVDSKEKDCRIGKIRDHNNFVWC